LLPLKAILKCQARKSSAQSRIQGFAETHDCFFYASKLQSVYKNNFACKKMQFFRQMLNKIQHLEFSISGLDSD